MLPGINIHRGNKLSIGFTKLGKRIKLVEKHGIANGDVDVVQLLKLLARHFPNINWKLVGQSDLSEMSNSQFYNMFPNNNVDEYKFGKNLDLMIVISGPYTSADIVNPQLSIINKTEKYIEISHDKRFSCANFDKLFFSPLVSLGQDNYSITNNFKQINTQYAYQELIYLFDKQFNPLPENFKETLAEKKDLLIIAAKSDYREQEVRKFVDPDKIECRLFGNLEIENFSYGGQFELEKLGQIANNYKYGFCIPVIPNYTTTKYIELLHNNVFPFLHPEYDSNNLSILAQNRLKVCRIKNQKDLESKIFDYNDAPHLFTETLKTYKSVLNNPDFYTGKFLADIIGKEIYNYA